MYFPVAILLLLAQTTVYCSGHGAISDLPMFHSDVSHKKNPSLTASLSSMLHGERNVNADPERAHSHMPRNSLLYANQLSNANTNGPPPSRQPPSQLTQQTQQTQQEEEEEIRRPPAVRIDSQPTNIETSHFKSKRSLLRWSKQFPDYVLDNFVDATNEFIGTFMFTLLKFSSEIKLNSMDLSPTQFAFYNSISVGVSLVITARLFSTGFFNTGISISKYITSQISLYKGLLLMVCQYTGSLSAGGLVELLARAKPGVPTITTTEGLSVFNEIVYGSVFVFSVLALTSKRHSFTILAPLEIGIALMIAALSSNGASLNANIAFASAAVSHQFPEGFYTTQVGNYAGGIVAGAVFLLLQQLTLLKSKLSDDPIASTEILVDKFQAILPKSERRSQAFSRDSSLQRFSDLHE